MNRVVATSRHSSRDFGSVEMWLSGLRHAGANGAMETSLRSNRSISEKFSKLITRVSQAVWHLLWEQKIVGSIPTPSTTCEHGSDSSCGRLKSGGCWCNPNCSHQCPISSRLAEHSTDNRSTVGRRHDWVPRLHRLKVRQLFYKQLSGRLPRDHGSTPCASTIGDLRMVSQAACKAVVSRQGWFDSIITDQFMRD